MELWPLVVPMLIVCAAAVSVVQRARRDDVIDVRDDAIEVDRVPLDLLRVDRSAPNGTGGAAPEGSLGARLRDIEPTSTSPVRSRPIRVRRRTQPLVAPGRRS